jgi:hypothetical protein
MQVSFPFKKQHFSVVGHSCIVLQQSPENEQSSGILSSVLWGIAAYVSYVLPRIHSRPIERSKIEGWMLHDAYASCKVDSLRVGI